MCVCGGGGGGEQFAQLSNWHSQTVGDNKANADQLPYMHLFLDPL